MTEVTLHPAPRVRDVVREQIRVVALGLRREAVVLAIVLGVVTMPIAFDIIRGNAETWFDSDEWVVIGVVAFLSPFAVWRRERRFGPAFLWTLPVDRSRLALARVFAGWVWLIAAFAVFYLWQLVLALLSGVENAETIPLFSVVGATAMYLFGSALVLGLRHPLRWLFGGAGVCVLLAAINDRVDRLLSSSDVPAALHDSAMLWLALTGAGLAALWAALSRHGERRSH